MAGYYKMKRYIKYNYQENVSESILSANQQNIKNIIDEDFEQKEKSRMYNLYCNYISDLVGTNTWLFVTFYNKSLYGERCIVKFLSETRTQYNLECRVVINGYVLDSEKLRVQKFNIVPISNKPTSYGEFTNGTYNIEEFITTTNPDNFGEYLKKLEG